MVQQVMPLDVDKVISSLDPALNICRFRDNFATDNPGDTRFINEKPVSKLTCLYYGLSSA